MSINVSSLGVFTEGRRCEGRALTYQTGPRHRLEWLIWVDITIEPGFAAGVIGHIFILKVPNPCCAFDKNRPIVTGPSCVIAELTRTTGCTEVSAW